MAKKNSDVSGFVLLSKQPGLTSFSSLFAVKKALGTSKVGHTGTLDSFAQGLLVVCVGNLTRLSSHITAFDKTYEAVIEFGKETDTLDPTGNVIKTAELPSIAKVEEALKVFTGKLMQAPPAFSALHVDGKRASDLTRNGIKVELQKRPIQVYNAELLETEMENDKVHYARVRFDVSKGTYIRSLARDIGEYCSSAAHLKGLLRTKVSCFRLEDAAGVELLKPFTIRNVIENLNSVPSDESFDYMMERIKEKISGMTKEVAEAAGLKPVILNEKYIKDFYNGRPLKVKYFEVNEDFFENEIKYAVFLNDGTFAGVISYCNNRFSYEYVIPLKKTQSQL